MRSALTAAAVLLTVHASSALAMTVEYVGEGSDKWTASQKARIQDLADRAEADVRRLLPLPQISLTLEVRVGNQVIPETGDGGATAKLDRIVWTANPAHAGGLDAVIESRLRKTLFHELHHVARGWTIADAPRIYTHFLDAAISEGMATVFAREFAQDQAPWGQYPANVADWAREVAALPADAPYPAWMFQHPDGRRWIGYAVGTYLVDRAVRATGKNAAALVTVPTAEVTAAAREQQK